MTSVDVATKARQATAGVEHFDVLVVGAGISGVGAAWHLTHQMAGTSFAVLEAKDTYGGTWVTHRYPGVRSDSDLYTFGYRFKPWRGAPIATSQEILTYMDEVIAENDLARHIRYGHKIVHAAWSSEQNLWTVDAVKTATGEPLTFTCGFLWMCQGYYHHDEGYTPEWPGMADFKGPIVHPQTWPEDLDYAGKKVVVIGSGATAATLVPALAAKAGHVTMLQRSPTYFATGRNANELADTLRDLEVPEEWTHEIVRRKILKDQGMFAHMAREYPDAVKDEILKNVAAVLPEGFDMKHFTPSYRPWQQRLAFVPDADLFKGISSGKASVVTDQIERFTAEGILLKSGDVLEADIIITATGFRLSVMGDIPFEVDGKPVDWGQTLTYRGMMFTGVPNLVWVFGYFRASWTLRVDLMGDFVARLLGHMKARGVKKVMVDPGEAGATMPRGPWIDPDNFNPGYLMRDMDKMPKCGDTAEWRHTQDYWVERADIPAIDLDGPIFRYDDQKAAARAIEAAE